MEAPQVRSVSPHDHSLPVLDGLRGLAIGLVLLVHAAFEMRQQIPDAKGVGSLLDVIDPLVGMGGTGVHLFFVLSGFLLFLPFARYLVGDRARPDTKAYLKRRALRILPAYYVVLVLDGLLFEREAVARDPLAQVVSHVLLVHNYSHLTFKGLDGPTWTMAVESQFYLLLPAMVLGLAWLSQRGRGWVLSGVLALASASALANALGVLLRRVLPGFSPYATVLSTMSFLTVFALGMGAAWVYVVATTGRLRRTRVAGGSAACGWLALVVFVGVAAKQALGISTSFFDFYLFATTMGLCYAGLLLFSTLRATVFSRALSHPAPRFVGDISFSLYLVHYPLLQHVVMPLASRSGTGWGPLTVALLGIGALIPISLASFWFVERPFLRAKAPQAEAAPAVTQR